MSLIDKKDGTDIIYQCNAIISPKGVLFDRWTACFFLLRPCSENRFDNLNTQFNMQAMSAREGYILSSNAFNYGLNCCQIHQKAKGHHGGLYYILNIFESRLYKNISYRTHGTFGLRVQMVSADFFHVFQKTSIAFILLLMYRGPERVFSLSITSNFSELFMPKSMSSRFLLLLGDVPFFPNSVLAQNYWKKCI